MSETTDLWRAITGHTLLERYGMTETGMITSIEPGLYKPGRYGIRHENLAVVTQALANQQVGTEGFSIQPPTAS